MVEIERQGFGMSKRGNSCAALKDTQVEITKAIESAEREGEKLVDHSMRQAIILIVIGLIGYVIATLFIRYVSNKMKTFAR